MQVRHLLTTRMILERDGAFTASSASEEPIIDAIPRKYFSVFFFSSQCRVKINQEHKCTLLHTRVLLNYHHGGVKWQE